MSGGAFDYKCFELDRLADDIECTRNPRWRKFVEHLRLVAKAAHDVEWVESGDYGEDGADEALAKIGCAT